MVILCLNLPCEHRYLLMSIIFRNAVIGRINEATDRLGFTSCELFFIRLSMYISVSICHISFLALWTLCLNQAWCCYHMVKRIQVFSSQTQWGLQLINEPQLSDPNSRYHISIRAAVYSLNTTWLTQTKWSLVSCTFALLPLEGTVEEL